MHHIDRIRLSNHPDPRMRAAAADAARLRSELAGRVLSRAFRRVLSAVKLSFRVATGRLGLSPGRSDFSNGMRAPWGVRRAEGCQ